METFRLEEIPCPYPRCRKRSLVAEVHTRINGEARDFTIENNVIRMGDYTWHEDTLLEYGKEPELIMLLCTACGSEIDIQELKGDPEPAEALNRILDRTKAQYTTRIGRVARTSRPPGRRYPREGLYSFTKTGTYASRGDPVPENRPLYESGTEVVNLGTGKRGRIHEHLGHLTHVDHRPGPACQHIYLVTQNDDAIYSAFENQLRKA